MKRFLFLLLLFWFWALGPLKIQTLSFGDTLKRDPPPVVGGNPRIVGLIYPVLYGSPICVEYERHFLLIGGQIIFLDRLVHIEDEEEILLPSCCEAGYHLQIYTCKIVDSYAFTAGWDDARNEPFMALYDLSDARNPRLLQLWYTKAEVEDLELISREGRPYLCVVGEFIDGIRILDVSDPANPTLIGKWSLGSEDDCDYVFFDSIITDGQYVYAVSSAGYLHIFDISHLKNPQLLFRAKIAELVTGIAVTENYLYLVAKSERFKGSPELLVFDKATFELTKRITLPGKNAGELALADDTVYIVTFTDSGSQLTMVALSDGLPDSKSIQAFPAFYNSTAIELGPQMAWSGPFLLIGGGFTGYYTIWLVPKTPGGVKAEISGEVIMPACQSPEEVKIKVLDKDGNQIVETRPDVKGNFSLGPEAIGPYVIKPELEGFDFEPEEVSAQVQKVCFTGKPAYPQIRFVNSSGALLSSAIEVTVYEVEEWKKVKGPSVITGGIWSLEDMNLVSDRRYGCLVTGEDYLPYAFQFGYKDDLCEVVQLESYAAVELRIKAGLNCDPVTSADLRLHGAIARDELAPDEFSKGRVFRLERPVDKILFAVTLETGKGNCPGRAIGEYRASWALKRTKMSPDGIPVLFPLREYEVLWNDKKEKTYNNWWEEDWTDFSFEDILRDKAVTWDYKGLIPYLKEYSLTDRDITGTVIKLPVILLFKADAYLRWGWGSPGTEQKKSEDYLFIILPNNYDFKAGESILQGLVFKQVESDLFSAYGEYVNWATSMGGEFQMAAGKLFDASVQAMIGDPAKNIASYGKDVFSELGEALIRGAKIPYVYFSSISTLTDFLWECYNWEEWASFTLSYTGETTNYATDYSRIIGDQNLIHTLGTDRSELEEKIRAVVKALWDKGELDENDKRLLEDLICETRKAMCYCIFKLDRAMNIVENKRDRLSKGARDAYRDLINWHKALLRIYTLIELWAERSLYRTYYTAGLEECAGLYP